MQDVDGGDVDCITFIFNPNPGPAVAVCGLDYPLSESI